MDGDRPRVGGVVVRSSGARCCSDGGAAFFDLDRTLMAGASAYHFGRAMYKAGQMTRRQIARDAIDQVRFRVNGATDAAVNVLLERVLEGIKGHRVVDLRRLTPGRAGRHPAARLSADAGGRARAQDAGRPVLHRDRGVPAGGRDPRRGARDGRRDRHCWEIDDGVYTGRLEGPFAYGEGKASVARVRRRTRHRPRGSPGPTPTRPPTCRCWRPSAIPWPSTRRRPCRDRAPRGLGGPAVREAGRAAAGGRRGAIAAAVGGSGTWLAARRRAPGAGTTGLLGSSRP